VKIASVRDLKDELLEMVEADSPLPTSITRSVTAASRSALVDNLAGSHIRRPSPVSVGVAQGGASKDYRVGVRIHASGARAVRLARECERRSKGEADVRIVPRIAAAPPTRAEARRATGASAAGARFRRRRRPLEAGYSVGHVNITAGTLGFFVEDEDAHYILSNNHVLADVNLGSPGDLIIQPGPADGPVAARNIVGVLDRFVPISFTRSNVVDCAIAAVRDGLDFYPWWNAALGAPVRKIRRINEADLGRRVCKVGRTTGVTHGTITQVEIDRLQVDMGEPGAPRLASFSDQFEVVGDDGRPFSLGGDSGSLIVDQGGHAIGLLFAGGPDDDGVDLTFANYIDTVFAKLGVTFVR
jgi:hypothetical protein